MRILIDTTYARRAPFSGTGIYIARVCAELARRGDVELIEVSNRRRRPPAGGGAGSARNLASDLWWTLHELPRIARRAGADVIHHPLPAHALRIRTPQVVTVVDLAFVRLPELFDRRFQLYAAVSHRAAARAARVVIAISETTATDVEELWGVERERIVVAPLGPGQELAALGETEGGRARHFLYVGDQEPRKNLPLLLEAYRRYRTATQAPLDLVLAGDVPPGGPGVRSVRRPGASELGALYRGAVALVHPSLYEGFGLTAVEAMTAGTPVLAARSPGVCEICADAARYVDPGDPDQLAAAMAELAADASLRSALVERGRRRAAEFSWARCADAHVEAYRRAVTAGRGE